MFSIKNALTILALFSCFWIASSEYTFAVSVPHPGLFFSDKAQAESTHGCPKDCEDHNEYKFTGKHHDVYSNVYCRCAPIDCSKDRTCSKDNEPVNLPDLKGEGDLEEFLSKANAECEKTCKSKQLVLFGNPSYQTQSICECEPPKE